ncbi:hypothetical protein P4O66_010862, partial [Electrophorus voltai]
MSSYFVNSAFPVSLPGGQESFLGQIPLYSSGYTDTLRHYPSATFGATNVQDKVYTPSYYQQATGVFGRTGSTTACDYAGSNMYRDAERSCTLGGLEDSLVLTQDQCKTDCSEQSSDRYSYSEDKPCTPVYPWMQRMNSCNGRYPNGSDYQLLNYGTNSAMNGSYRDTSMHSGSFGYTYNGIDLSVNRSNNNAHFGAVGDNARAFQSPGTDTRYRQTSCSLASPDPLPCANSETLNLKGSSPSSDQSTTGGNNRLTSNNLTSSNSTHFVETDETNVSSETEEDMTGPDGKRARTAYTRYQTLELEKEFHFN